MAVHAPRRENEAVSQHPDLPSIRHSTRREVEGCLGVCRQGSLFFSWAKEYQIIPEGIIYPEKYSLPSHRDCTCRCGAVVREIKICK